MSTGTLEETTNLDRAKLKESSQQILVFNWCYHGTVDETFVNLENGKVVPRKGNLGPPGDPARTTVFITWL